MQPPYQAKFATFGGTAPIMQQRDANFVPQGISPFRPFDNSPFKQHSSRKTEYTHKILLCFSFFEQIYCSRYLFQLQEISKKIQSSTEHYGFFFRFIVTADSRRSSVFAGSGAAPMQFARTSLSEIFFFLRFLEVASLRRE